MKGKGSRFPGSETTREKIGKQVPAHWKAGTGCGLGGSTVTVVEKP